MTATWISLALSFVGLIIYACALWPSVVEGTPFDPDIKMITMLMVGSAATICSWLARIEASIDARKLE